MNPMMCLVQRSLSHAQSWYGHILGNWQVNGITTRAAQRSGRRSAGSIRVRFNTRRWDNSETSAATRWMARHFSNGIFRRSRRFPSASVDLQFRAEIFNIFNNVNFQLPNNDINSLGFGQIEAAQPGRIVQLALKFMF